jgi:hypothetical protein
VTADPLSSASSSIDIRPERGATVTSRDSLSTRFDDDVIRRWVERERPAERRTTPANGRDISTAAVSAQRLSAPPVDLGVFKYPQPARELPREQVLQEWEGQVQEVGERQFSARLVDLTQGTKEETEESDLPIDDLVEGDQALLVPGAVFRWIIGYRWLNGEKERFTRVVIRRLPIWTDQEIKSADERAAELHDALFGNEDQRAAHPGSD